MGISCVSNVTKNKMNPKQDKCEKKFFKTYTDCDGKVHQINKEGYSVTIVSGKPVVDQLPPKSPSRCEHLVADGKTTKANGDYVCNDCGEFVKRFPQPDKSGEECDEVELVMTEVKKYFRRCGFMRVEPVQAKFLTLIEPLVTKAKMEEREKMRSNAIECIGKIGVGHPVGLYYQGAEEALLTVIDETTNKHLLTKSLEGK